MAARRRSIATRAMAGVEVAPAVAAKPPRIKSIIAAAPTARCSAASTASSRARGRLPSAARDLAGVKKPNVSNRKVSQKRKEEKEEKAVDGFVTGDKFDFELPETPSLSGPITRARRMSIYGKTSATPAPTKLPTTRIRTSGRRKNAPAVSSTTTVIKSVVEEITPLMTEPLVTPMAHLGRQKTKAMPDSHRETDKKSAGTRLSSKIMEAGAVQFTPQLGDPANILRSNIKSKIERQIEQKVSELPATSPYALLTGETESGSPIEQMVKVRKGLERFVTAEDTTTPPFKCNKKRMAVLDSVGFDCCDGRPESKRHQSVRNLLFSNMSTVESEEEEEDENRPVSQPGTKFPEHHSQEVTGDLAKACSIQ